MVHKTTETEASATTEPGAEAGRVREARAVARAEAESETGAGAKGEAEALTEAGAVAEEGAEEQRPLTLSNFRKSLFEKSPTSVVHICTETLNK